MTDRSTILTALLSEAAVGPAREIRKALDAIATDHERRLRELLLKLAR